MQPKILLYDIEVTSDVGDSWKKWDTNIHHYRRDWYILCFAYKWLGQKKTHVVAQPDFKRYKKEPYNDLDVVKKLHDLYNEADVLIAHNGDQFDQKKSQTRMFMQKLEPPMPYKQIDTRKEAKKHFAFTSNKLDDLARYLGIPGKYDTGGYGLWIGCEEGDPKAWAKMKRYNKQDVDVLEQVYLRMRPWIKNHPALNVLADEPDACKHCLSTDIRLGMKYVASNATKWQYARCMNCAAPLKLSRGIAIKSKYR